MPHLDEGLLHTVLDEQVDALGTAAAARVREHLAGCAECRTRLEEERDLRDRATAFLATDDPLDGLALPTLDEMRLEAARAPRSSGPARSWAVGWAASVVLALGVGYGVGVMDGPLPTAPRDVTSSEAVAGPEDGTALEDAAAEDATEAGSGGEAGASNEAEAEDRSEVAAAQAPPVVRPSPPPNPLPQSTARALRETRGGAVPGFDSALARALRDEPIRLLAEEESRALPARATEPGELPSLVRAPVTASAPARDLSLDDLGGVGGAAALRLRVVEVAGEEVWPGQAGVRLVQALDDGRLVELRVAGPGGNGQDLAPPPSSGIDLPPGWSRVTGELRGGWADLRGPLPVSELNALLRALASAGG